MPTALAKARALVAGAALLLAGGTAGLLASPASAATGDLKITNTTSGRGATSGDNFAVPGFTTPAECGAGTTRHVTRVVDAVAKSPADQAAFAGWKDKNFYSPSSVGLPGPLSEYPSSANLQGLANTYGLPLVAGTWTVETRCQNNLGTSVLDTFTGTIVWDGPTSWRTPVVTTATSTALVATPTGATVGGTVTLTATVSAAGATPTGSVTFTDGTTTLGSADVGTDGTAVLKTATLAVGSHGIKASYAPTGAFEASTSATTTVTVDALAAVPTTTSLSVAPPSAPEGDPVAFTATVTAKTGTASGTVTYREGTKTLGTAAVTSGSATFSTTMLTPGTHEVTAGFSDSTSAFGSSTSEPVTVTVTVVEKKTTTTLAAAPASAEVGSGVILSATVAPGTATGTVRFLDGTTFLGEANVESGKATITSSTLAVGAHQVTAEYLGAEGTFAASTSAAVTVTIRERTSTTDTSTTLEVAPEGDLSEGGEVTMTAAVTGADDATVSGGSVEFYDGTTLLGTAEIPAEGGATATFATSDLTIGDHQLTARYTGTETFAASTSDVVTVSVLAADGGGSDGDGSGGSAGSGGTEGGGTGGVLAQTGTALGVLGGAGGLLLAAGVALVLLGRRRGWSGLTARFSRTT